MSKCVVAPYDRNAHHLAPRQRGRRHFRILTRSATCTVPVSAALAPEPGVCPSTLAERFAARHILCLMTFMPDRPDPQESDRPGDPADKNDQRNETPEEPHPDAFEAISQPPGDRGEVRGGGRALATPPDRDTTRLTQRDHEVISHLVRFRVLTYDQIHRLAFASADPSISRRRIRHLARSGWLSTWEAPSLHGGHTRYAHPSARAIRIVLPELTPDALWSPLIQRMVPLSHRRPLTLGDSTPKWLAHQREVNHLVTSIATSSARRILWASSWDCPFPSRVGMFTMPQPDYVLVEEVDGAPQLVFGEHDRGHEPLDRFTARKIALYSALAEFPEVCEQQFGIATFRVDVTVIDQVRRAPIARLRSLLEAARASMRPDIFRFTLGGWLHAFPDAQIWFAVSRPPANDSMALRDHSNLAPLS